MAVYLVKSPDGAERLVEAANRASARNHVAKAVLDVAVAKQADLFRVAKAGGDIETAGEVVPEQGGEPQGGGLPELEELAATQTDDTRDQQPEVEAPTKAKK